MAQESTLNWNDASLNKAYQQGFMAGALGMDRVKCPYCSDVVSAAWEAGWEDGLEDTRAPDQSLPEIA